MALPNRLWLPDGGQDLPVFPVERVSAEVGPQLGSRWRKRAVLAGVEGQAERTVLVEWFSVADLVSSQLAPLRSVCHSNLLRLHQFGQSDGKTAYAISEAPLGLDLLQVARTLPGKLPAWWAVSVVHEAARGILALHQHLARRGRARGHGALDASCVFVSSAGRVQVLAFAPLPRHVSSDVLGEDPIAPEVRRGSKLAMAASDVYSLATLLLSLPLDRPLPDALLRLLRRGQSVFAEKRPTLTLLIQQLGDARWQLGAPLALAERIGAELGRLLPTTRSQSLGESEWGSAGPVSFGPLPKTLYPLSATAVSLSATWDAAPQVDVQPTPGRRRVWPLALLVGSLAVRGVAPSGPDAAAVRARPRQFRGAATIGTGRGGAGGGGATTPMEMMYFSASSTLICSGRTLVRGISRKKPLVGLGVVGTYRLTCSPSRCAATSPLGLPVTKAIVQLPWCGYCTSTASRKALPLLENSVSETCLTEL